MQTFEQMSVEMLAERMAEAENNPQVSLQLLDVREPFEVEIARIVGFENLPLSSFREWSTQIKTRFNPEVETLVLCHHGMRSAQMCDWLVSQGFVNVKNVAGGIDAYSLQVDRSVPRY